MSRFIKRPLTVPDNARPLGRANRENVGILLISGIPCAGKSHFGSWLEDTHSYLHLDVEKDGRLASYGLLGPWNACFKVGNVDGFVRSLGKLGQSVALNWGFPPRWLGVVKKFKVAGVTLWWFDADHAAARAAFLARGDGLIKDFEVQIGAIKSGWGDIKETFDPHIITTLRADGTRLDPKAIYKTMFRRSSQHG